MKTKKVKYNASFTYFIEYFFYYKLIIYYGENRTKKLQEQYVIAGME